MSEDEARVERVIQAQVEAVAKALEEIYDQIFDPTPAQRARAAIAAIAATAWQPIETAPRDRNIQAWHVSWKCPITVRYLHDGISDCCWIEKTLTTRWPARAFSHWKPPVNTP